MHDACRSLSSFIIALSCLISCNLAVTVVCVSVLAEIPGARHPQGALPDAASRRGAAPHAAQDALQGQVVTSPQQFRSNTHLNMLLLHLFH